jgi:Fe2+ or Zn2+ uptake regulation protein
MDKCDARALLKEHNLKVTNQRKLLLEAIIRSNSIFSAGSLQDNVKDRMDVATVYRILGMLVANGIIREVSSSDNTQYYELRCEHHPLHPHFVCKRCKRIFCLDKIGAKDVSRIKQYASRHVIDDIAVQLRGLCNKCK